MEGSKRTWWLPAPNVVARRLDDEIVLVQLQTNRLYALNRTGARFWELLTEGRPHAEVSEQLRAEFAVEPDELEAEIDALCRRLADAGLLTEKP